MGYGKLKEAKIGELFKDSFIEGFGYTKDYCQYG